MLLGRGLFASSTPAVVPLRQYIPLCHPIIWASATAAAASKAVAAANMSKIDLIMCYISSSTDVKNRNAAVQPLKNTEYTSMKGQWYTNLLYVHS